MASIDAVSHNPPVNLAAHQKTLFERIGRLPFVGRQGELQILEQAVRLACSGEGRIVILCGEAGIGKTRLLREAGRMAAGAGAVALQGECVSEQGAPPYFVWINALRDMPDQTARILLEGTAGSDNAIPYNSWRPRRMTAEEARFRLFSDVVSALDRVCRQRPVVITLDDLQWSAPSSLQLLGFLANHLSSMALAIVGAYRIEDTSPDSPLAILVDEIEAKRKGTMVTVPAFTPQETGMAVTALLGFESPEIASALDAHSEGNPFVLEETVRSLATVHGANFETQVLGQGGLPLPESVSAAIRLRLDRLNELERSTISLAAVVGKQCDASVIAGALALEQTRVEGVLANLVRSAMLRLEPDSRGIGDAYAFLHDRIREVVLDAMSPGERSRQHAAVAAALMSAPGFERNPNVLAALANHLRHAGRKAEAGQYFAKVGEMALSRRAPEEAATAYGAAVELLGSERADPMQLGNLEMALGIALQMSGKAEARDAFSRAVAEFLRAGAVIEAGVAADHQGLSLSSEEKHDQAIATYFSALDLLGSTSQTERARASILIHLADTLGLSLGRYDEALSTLREALAMLRSGEGGDPLRAVASLSLARTLTRMNRLDDARAVLDESLPAATGGGEFGLAADMQGALANVMYWKGDVRQSRTATLRRQAYAGNTGDRFHRRHICSWLAFVEIALGDWQEASRLLAEARQDVGGLDSPEPGAFIDHIAGFLAYLRGDLAGARELMLRSLPVFRAIGPATVLWYIGAAARSCMAQGDRDTGDALIEETWDLLEDLPEAALPRGASLEELALIAVETGNTERAGVLYQALVPFSGQLHWALIDRVLGMLAAAMNQPGLAMRHFDDAIAQSKRYGLRPELAIAMAERAYLARASGTSNETERLDRSLARLRSMGLHGEVARIADRSAPIPARTETIRPANLTDREIEVLRLIAAGLTNKEIAAKLGIADKTVTNHISHIFDKADLENRAAAAVFAVRHHLD